MKETVRRKIKIVTSFTTCIISLFVAVTLTFAWFAQNNKVDGGNMNIGLTDDKNVLGVEYYSVASVNKDGTYTFEVAADDTATLGKYDVLTDDYHMIMRVFVKESITSVKLSAETSTASFVGNTKNALLPDTDDNWKTTNFLTSIFGMKVINFDYDTLNLAKKPTTLSSFFPDKAAILNQTAAPVNFEIALNDYLVDDAANNRKYFSLFLTYDDSLVASVFSANIGNDKVNKIGEDGEPITIPFVVDFALSLRFD